jgi:hypothetical protein
VREGDGGDRERATHPAEASLRFPPASSPEEEMGRCGCCFDSQVGLTSGLVQPSLFFFFFSFSFYLFLSLPLLRHRLVNAYGKYHLVLSYCF